MITAYRAGDLPGTPWTPRWDALAAQILAALRLGPGERVVYSLNPYVHPELIEAVRVAVLARGAIEHGAQLQWTERLSALRGHRGMNPDAEAGRREDVALLDLLNTADVFIWLPCDYLRRSSYTARQSEWALGRWRGRSVHFHMTPEYGHGDRADPVHQRIWRTIERAVLEVDYDAMRRVQERLVAAIRGRTLHVTTPDGTDLKVRLPKDGWYHLNHGDASPERAAKAVCARDREEELPAGSVRALPVVESAEGIISYRRGQGVFHDDFARLTGHLDVVFRGGRVTELRAGPRQAEADAMWARHTGDKDRLTEVVFGTNPLLPMVEGSVQPTYWGYGAGVFRFHLGDITESGGPWESSLTAELFMSDATVRADGDTIVRDGRLLID